MAASVAEKDYVHLVIDGVAQRNGQKPESKVVNLAEFERGFETFDFAAKLKAEVDFHADTIVIALGENVPALTTDEDRTKFQERTTKLLHHLKAAGPATIYVRSCFWPDEPKDAALKAACEAVGGVFVDIGALAKDEANFARSERKIDHVGVAGHPGDKGMKAIAEALLAAMAKAKK
jgi:alpha-galactosidase